MFGQMSLQLFFDELLVKGALERHVCETSKVDVGANEKKRRETLSGWAHSSVIEGHRDHAEKKLCWMTVGSVYLTLLYLNSPRYYGTTEHAGLFQDKRG
jgi:hypothetical protein